MSPTILHGNKVHCGSFACTKEMRKLQWTTNKMFHFMFWCNSFHPYLSSIFWQTCLLGLDRDYSIRSNFWKFYLIRTNFTFGEPIFLVKVFRLFRSKRIFFGVQSVNIVGRCTISYLLAGPVCLWCLVVSWSSPPSPIHSNLLDVIIEQFQTDNNPCMHAKRTTP
jgi:hypothetical protein